MSHSTFLCRTSGYYMTNEDKNKRIIDIADFLFANPDKGRADILAKFGENWRNMAKHVGYVARKTIYFLVKHDDDAENDEGKTIYLLK
ncbi:hypothetical protein EZS27_035988 [termite gut metagenome]|uniref:Uncharacterized protein n=1 Tax=termite gut metagenome TaxID=433724 RepID=A0A5J4PWX0_9ZZZZ